MVALTLLLALTIGEAAHAALTARLSKDTARPGQSVRLILGEAAYLFRAPLNLYLVPRTAAPEVADQSDTRLVKLASFGTPGKFDVPRLFDFAVPQVPPGEYVVALWFRGTMTGEWANVLEGVEPTLTITASSATRGWAADFAVWFAALGGAVMILLASSLLGWRLRRRRSPASRG